MGKETDDGQKSHTNDDKHGNESTLHRGILSVGGCSNLGVTSCGIRLFVGADIFEHIGHTVSSSDGGNTALARHTGFFLSNREAVRKPNKVSLLQVKGVGLLQDHWDVLAGTEVGNGAGCGFRVLSTSGNTSAVSIVEDNGLGLGVVLGTNDCVQGVAVDGSDRALFHVFGDILAVQETSGSEDLGDAILLVGGSSEFGSGCDVSILTTPAGTDGVLEASGNFIGTEFRVSSLVHIVHMLVETSLTDGQVHEHLNFTLGVRKIRDRGVLGIGLGSHSASSDGRSRHGTDPVPFHVVPKIIARLEVGRDAGIVLDVAAALVQRLVAQGVAGVGIFIHDWIGLSSHAAREQHEERSEELHGC
mmetsp:Transcript_45695/g.84810  ORF Transcript_45695/g.84810 Transcript_45695/m.84810 type:complete len:360 (-) Transcript_45695:64-1143(-)